MFRHSCSRKKVSKSNQVAHWTTSWYSVKSICFRRLKYYWQFDIDRCKSKSHTHCVTLVAWNNIMSYPLHTFTQANDTLLLSFIRGIEFVARQRGCHCCYFCCCCLCRCWWWWAAFKKTGLCLLVVFFMPYRMPRLCGSSSSSCCPDSKLCCQVARVKCFRAFHRPNSLCCIRSSGGQRLLPISPTLDSPMSTARPNSSVSCMPCVAKCRHVCV